MSSEKALSYGYEEFMKYQEINNKLPQELVSYCVYDTNNTSPDMSNYEEQLTEIIGSITKGIDVNSVVFRNNVKGCINMVNQSNYNDFLQKLKGLDYATKENIHFLASELIVGAIRCPVSVKGFTFEEDPKFKAVPEICADIAKHFSSFMIENKSGSFQFHDEITKICQEYFLDFVDMNKSMDENNEDTADNYKGFMTFMGLLYSRGVVNIKAVINCMDSIKRAIFVTSCMAKEHMVISNDIQHLCCDVSNSKLMGSHSKQNDNKLSKLICYYDCNKCPQPTESNQLVTYRKHIECSNLHKGYEHLMNHVIRSLEIRSNDLLKTLNEKEVLLKSEINPSRVRVGDNRPIEQSPDLPDENKTTLIESRNSTVSIIDKLCSFVDAIIVSHQEMINLNKCYVSVSTGSSGSSQTKRSTYVPPFRNNSILNHNALGTQLNKLQDRLMPHSSQYTTRYSAPTRSVAV